jgi:hypothetical protein
MLTGAGCGFDEAPLKRLFHAMRNGELLSTARDAQNELRSLKIPTLRTVQILNHLFGVGFILNSNVLETKNRPINYYRADS